MKKNRGKRALWNIYLAATLKRRCSQTQRCHPLRQRFCLRIIDEVDGEGKLSIGEPRFTSLLALSTPLFIFFFHAFYRSIFTHHRAPKAGIYQSVEHLLYSRARGCKPSLVGTSHGECLRGLRSYERFHTLRRRALCGGHSMPRRKIYDIAICATIYYKIAVSDIHPPSHSIATIFLPFLSPSSPRITRLRIFGIVSLSCTRFIYLFFCRQLS